MDAWDGYDAERDFIARQVKENNVENLVVLTGDLHSYIASHVKLDYLDPDRDNEDNFVAVEFMTPSVTSAGLLQLLKLQDTNPEYSSPAEKLLIDAILQGVAHIQNPHIYFFNSTDNGYSTVEFSKDHCDWKCYRVDKNVNDGNQTPKMLRHYRKVQGNHKLVRMD